MSGYPGASNGGPPPPPPFTYPAVPPQQPTAPYPVAMPQVGDEKPPVDANGYPLAPVAMPDANDAFKYKNYGATPDAKDKNLTVVPPPPQGSVDPYNIQPSGPNGQYTVEDYQRMAQARTPRFPIEQYGRCPKDAGEHYVREEYTNGSLCLAVLCGWIFPVCVTKQLKCRKCGQVF
ncbi:hypothetical protein BDF19DRAFT_441689 [Syncephalis fuscata]|nr:hypothetical protein BDF19DRAFT_441689 [Syncephalis fuscata]